MLLYKEVDSSLYSRSLEVETITNYDFVLLREGRDNTVFKENAAGTYPTVTNAEYVFKNPSGGETGRGPAGVVSFDVNPNGLALNQGLAAWLESQKGIAIVNELERVLKESLALHDWTGTSFDTYPSTDPYIVDIPVTSVISSNNVYYHKIAEPNFTTGNVTLSWEWYPEEYFMDFYTHLALMRVKEDIDQGKISCSDTMKEMVQSIKAGRNDPDAIDWFVNIDGVQAPIITLSWNGKNEAKYKHASMNLFVANKTTEHFLGSVTYDSESKTWGFNDLYGTISSGNEAIDYIKGLISQFVPNAFVDLRFQCVYTDPLTAQTKLTSKCHAKIFSNGDCNDYGFADDKQDGSTVTITRVNTDDLIPGYDPDDPSTPGGDIIEPDDPLNPKTGPIQAISGVSILTKSYLCTEQQLKDLGGVLWSQSLIENIFEVNQSPVENIISCKAYVFDVPHGQQSEIVLGNYHTGITAYGITSNTNFSIDVGTFKIPSYYNHSWLDYKMTSISIYLPFCGGLHPLDVFNYMDKTISVKYFVDTITGTCKACLYSKGVIIDEFAGQMGVDIPITAQNRASQELSQITSVGGSAITAGGALGALAAGATAASVALPVAVGAIGAGLLAGIARPKDPISHVGSNSPTCSMMTTHDVYLVVNRPRVNPPSNYGRVYGYPAYYKSALQSLSGFTKCDNVDVENVTCTDEERQMIKSLLESGVYIESGVS